MKLLRIATACAALGVAAWTPTPAAAMPAQAPQATVQLAQYAPPFRHRHWRHRYYRHHRWFYVY